MGGSLHVPAVATGNIPSFFTCVDDIVKFCQDQELVVFTCQYSAHRAPTCANWYTELADRRQRVAILSGGYRAWEGFGFPVAQQHAADQHAADAFALQQGM